MSVTNWSIFIVFYSHLSGDWSNRFHRFSCSFFFRSFLTGSVLHDSIPTEIGCDRSITSAAAAAVAAQRQRQRQTILCCHGYQQSGMAGEPTLLTTTTTTIPHSEEKGSELILLQTWFFFFFFFFFVQMGWGCKLLLGCGDGFTYEMCSGSAEVRVRGVLFNRAVNAVCTRMW